MAQSKKVVLKYCVGCQRELASDKFNTSNIDYHSNGCLPYCKDCVQKIFTENMNHMSTLEGAIYATCCAFNVPFIKSIFTRYSESYFSKGYKYTFAGYFNMLQNNKLYSPKGFYQTDTDFKDIAGLSQNEQNIKADTEKLKLEWGIQTIEDYQFLIYLFKKYTDNVHFENPMHEDLFRDLCLARLELRKIQEGDSQEDLQKAQTRVLTLMNKLKLDEFDSNKPKTISEQMIFQKITMIDENNVEDIYKEPRKFADFNRYIEYIKKFSLRPLANMLAGHKDFDIDLSDLERYDFTDDK